MHFKDKDKMIEIEMSRNLKEKIWNELTALSIAMNVLCYNDETLIG